jgi:hypothetical protein
MGGGLMQLVAYGAQDIYLTGNPQITFFKVVYRRHTNFSMESIKQTFNGNTDFGNDVSATISRNGDLVYRMYLEADCDFTNAATDDAEDNIGLCERYGDSLIKECEIEIGGQRIDKHTSMWNRVYSDLTEFNPSGYFGLGTPASGLPSSGTPPVGTGSLYQLMTGNGYGLNTDVQGAAANDFSTSTGTTVNGIKYTVAGGSTGLGKIETHVFIPLNFWFCRNPGLALPLIALQYHEVKVKITLESIGNLTRTSTGAAFTTPIPGTSTSVTTSKNIDLWCDYIYLDTDERRRFAQVSHEYLIEQLQYSETTISSAAPSIDLNFNHPVKELIWTFRNETPVNGVADGGRNQALTVATGDGTAGPVSLDTIGGNWQLKLNGHDRFKERDSKYFTRTQVWQHHTGYGGIPTAGHEDFDGGSAVSLIMGGDSIAVYSFALKPEEHQPSGTCNFSRIDNAQLVGSSLTTFAASGAGAASETTAIASSGDASSVKLTIFAVNYNVLRIMSGMGGLAYSN